MKKTVVFINFRFGGFYSEDLLQRVKSTGDVRVIAIVDNFFKDNIPHDFLNELDDMYHLSTKLKNDFLYEFDFNDLALIIQKEQIRYPDRKITLVCTDEFNLLSVARLRQKFQLDGIDSETIMRCRDKLLMKTILKDKKIRVPKCLSFNDIIDKTESQLYEFICENIGCNIIAKPVDSCGSQGIYHITNQEEFIDFYQTKAWQQTHYEIEEYIEGTLFHVDSVIENGEIKFLKSSIYSCPNHKLTQGEILASKPVIRNKFLAKRLQDFATQVLAALEIKHCVNHIEIFEKDGELIFLEIAARPPGAILNQMHQYNFGINLMDWDFKLQSKVDISLPSYDIRPAFWAFFPLLPGKVKSLNEPKLISDYTIEWRVENGQTIQNYASDIVDIAGILRVFADSYDSLIKDFDYIKSFTPMEFEDA